MHIKSIRVSNFKSFGTEQSVSFHKGLNIIIGPNGVGKSNLLDALSFAFGESDNKNLRVSSMVELMGTDPKKKADQLKENATVEVVLEQGSNKYTIKATLRSDASDKGVRGSREFRLNGKQIPLIQLREWLRREGLPVDDSVYVLRQANVSDIRSAAEVAKVISVASGAHDLQQQTNQLQKQRHKWQASLTEIDQNISTLQRYISKFDEARAIDKKLQGNSAKTTFMVLESKALRAELTSMKIAFHESKLTHIDKELDTHRSRLNDLKTAAIEDNQRAEKLKEEVSRLECERDELQASDEKDSAAVEEMRAKLQRTTSKAHALTAQQNKRRELQAELTRHSKEKAACKQRLQAAQSELSLLQSAVASYEQSKQALKDTRSREELGDRLSALRADLKKSKSDAQAGDTNMQRMKDGLDERERQERTVQKRLKEMETRLATLKAHLAAKEKRSKEMEGLGRSIRAARSKMLSTLHLPPDLASLQTVTPLIDTFTLTDAAHPLLPALTAIAGSKLAVLLTSSADDATGVLHEAKKRGSQVAVRIWPLKTIAVNLPSAMQDPGVKTEGGHRGTSFLTFDSKFAKALSKAFDSALIADDDSTAVRLLNRFGVPVVTKAGCRHERGSLLGASESSTTSAVLNLKAALDKDKERLRGLQREAAGVSSAVEEAEARDIEQEMQTEADTLANVQAELQLIRKQLGDASDRRSRFSMKAELLEQEIKSLADLLDGADGPDCAVADVRKALADLESKLKATNKNVSKARDAIGRLRKEIDGLIAKEEESRTEMECIAGGADNEDEDMAATLQADAARYAADLSVVTERQQANQQRLEAVQQSLVKTDRTLKQMDKDRQDRKEAKTSLEGDIERLHVSREECAAALEDLREEAGDAAGSDDHPTQMRDHHRGISQKHIDHVERKLLELSAESKQLQIKKESAGGDALDEQARDVLRQLEAFKANRKVIEESIACVIQGIQSEKEKIHTLHQTSFKRVKELTKDLFESLMPSKEIDFVMNDSSDLLQGVAIRVRNKLEGGDVSGWKDGLEELSGGQRTLLSVAFLLAIAQNRSSFLYILDEADASSDEKMTQALASLLRHKFTNMTQVICVSHHAVFQQQAQRLISLAKNKSGHTVLAKYSDR
ncbi:unnamed protein product [Vitrella brassicaformis CCMP3155]|uniref:SMC hinge domain-containing protein n=1 Tax=Vitrella brassicaformis (strain CCMP3155) TaxID=1169540 RepID=A0A0G4FN43_VITBC|nr:unnamed protein product [Vitrella brassicaformis CCMP3155]|eukprot:CEM14996.1 unnamed protein product [Vitrella brassicaformis CCMP3155]